MFPYDGLKRVQAFVESGSLQIEEDTCRIDYSLQIFRRHKERLFRERGRCETVLHGRVANAINRDNEIPVRKTNFVQRGGFWVLSQGLLLLGVVLLAVRFRRERRHIVAVISGGILLTIGTGVALTGAIALGRNITPFPKPSEKAQLVRHGIFSLIRHPIYTGVMFASLGWALVWQSWPALLTASGLIPFFDAKTRREEKWLREKFADYGEYEKCVKRFIPRIY